MVLLYVLYERQMSGKKVLITGASGFIGGFLVEEALRRRYEVWAGVRSSSSKSHLQDERIRFIDLRYGDAAALTAQVRRFAEEQGAWDYVIHNAGLTKTPNPANFYQVNTENTRQLVQALIDSDRPLRKFILMSSLSSYGPGDEVGFQPIRLDDPQRPNTTYGKSKLEAENVVRQQTRLPYVIIRPTGVYGPGEKDYLLAMQSIRSGFDFTAGLTPQRITFIYVKDLVRAVFLCLEKEEIRNRHYFVADGDVYTDQEFSRMVQDLLGKSFVWHTRLPLGLVRLACVCCERVGRWMKKGVTLNTDKYLILRQRNWICDIAPLQEDTGFVPAYTLRQGLEESIAWYKEKGWL